MSKKYYPSGYQIIDLTDELFDEGDEIQDSLLTDAKVLTQVVKNKTILKKPLLLKIKTVEGSFIGFPSVTMNDDESACDIVCLLSISANNMSHCILSYDYETDVFTVHLMGHQL